MRWSRSGLAIATSAPALASVLRPPPSSCAGANTPPTILPAGITDISPLQLQVAGVSGVTGYTVGFAAKRAFRVFVFTAGCACAGLQTLAYNGLITVHWDKIEKRLNSAIDMNAAGSLDVSDLSLGSEKMQAYLATGLPCAGSFSTGFILGLRS